MTIRPNGSPSIVIIAAIAVGWLLYMVVLVLYSQGSGDEGPYHNQAVKMAHGYWPVLDFYTLHPIWGYLPYVAAAKWLSPAVEAMRLVSLTLMTVSVVAIGLTVARHCGRRMGLWAFLVLGTSWPWLYANIELGHNAPMNFGLVMALVLLHWPWQRWTTFAIGFFLAVMINSRVVLAPLCLLFLVLVLWRRPSHQAWWQSVVPLVMGGVLASAPTLYILVADPEAFYFNYLGLRLEWTRSIADLHPPAESTMGQAALWFIGNRLSGLVDFFYGWNYNQFGQNIVILAPLLAAMVVLRKYPRSLLSQGIRHHNALITDTVAVSVAVVLCYSVGDRFVPFYLHPVIPFILIASLAILHGVEIETGTTTRLTTFLMRGALALSLAYFGVRTLHEIIGRDLQAFTAPMTTARVACWIEANVPPADQVMNFIGEPVAAAGRTLPDGFDQGQGLLTLAMLLPSLDEPRAQRFHLLTAEHYKQMLADGSLPVVLRDPSDERAIAPDDKKRLAEVPELLARYYVMMGESGGTGPYILYVRKERATEMRPLVPRVSPVYQGSLAEMAAHGDIPGFAHLAFRYVTDDLLTLPADLSASLARAIWASYPARCGQFNLQASRGSASNLPGH